MPNRWVGQKNLAQRVFPIKLYGVGKLTRSCPNPIIVKEIVK